jgi:hypothetical protein
MGKGYVPCQVSGRWLQFSEESTVLLSGEYIPIDVKTLGKDGKP